MRNVQLTPQNWKETLGPALGEIANNLMARVGSLHELSEAVAQAESDTERSLFLRAAKDKGEALLECGETGLALSFYQLAGTEIASSQLRDMGQYFLAEGYLDQARVAFTSLGTSASEDLIKLGNKFVSDGYWDQARRTFAAAGISAVPSLQALMQSFLSNGYVFEAKTTNSIIKLLQNGEPIPKNLID